MGTFMVRQVRDTSGLRKEAKKQRFNNLNLLTMVEGTMDRVQRVVRMQTDLMLEKKTLRRQIERLATAHKRLPPTVKDSPLIKRLHRAAATASSQGRMVLRIRV